MTACRTPGFAGSPPNAHSLHWGEKCSLWSLGGEIGDNPPMDLTQDQVDQLEAVLARLAEIDPAELPEPAAELASLLGSILEEQETP